MAGSDHRLRLVTMNVQLMTQDAYLNTQAVETRAHAVAEAFLADTWPDVICLNEVFYDGARSILRDRLMPVWRNVEPKFGPTRTVDPEDKIAWATAFVASLPAGHPLLLVPLAVAIQTLLEVIPLPADAGLMVFSRFPIEGSAFVSYRDHIASDSLADKGAALVQIRRSPQCVYNVVATHMQAAYATQVEHAGVRVKQLDQIRELIETHALRDFVTDTRVATVVCGDLNIQGSGAARSEWVDVFINGTAGPFYVQRMADGWNHYVSPGNVAGNDPGITNRDGGHDWDNRLDYVLLLDYAKESVVSPRRRPFAVQRMFLAHPGQSDHIGLGAEINLDGRYRSPAFARDMGSAALADVFTTQLDEAGMAWLRFQGPATWSFNVDDHTLHEVYLPGDMSQPYRLAFSTDLTQVPHGAGALAPRGHADMQTVASTYVINVPAFYVRVFRRDDGHGTVTLGYCRHLGTTPFDPIGVAPQADPVGPDWQALATVAINPPMDFWFSCQTRSARNNAPHTSEFEVLNPTGRTLTAAILHRPDVGSEAGQEVWAGGRSDTPLLQLSAHRAEGRRLLWQVRRESLSQTGFRVRWFSALNFLIYPRADAPTLYCADETGIDSIGGDEISLEARPDGDFPIRLLNAKEDVDTGETVTLPSPEAANWQPEQTGYLARLAVRIIEDEDVGGNDLSSADVPALARHQASGGFTVTLRPGTGRYILKLRIAREPT